MKIFAVSGWKGSGKDMVADYLVRERGFKRVSFADKLKDIVAEQFDVPRTHLDSVQHKEAPILSMPVDPKDEYSRMINEYLYKQFRYADGGAPTGFRYENGKFLGVRLMNVMETEIIGEQETIGEYVRKSVTEQLYWTPRALAILEGSTKRSANSNYWVERAVKNLDPDKNYVISDARFKNELAQLNISAPGAVVEVRINRFHDVNSTDASERDLDDYQFENVINNMQDQGVTREAVYAQVEAILEKTLRNK